MLISRILLSLRSLFWTLVYRGYRQQYDIDAGFRFNGAGIQLYGEGRIILGRDSYIGELSTIQAVKGHKVVIGNRCSISHNVRIYTSTWKADSNFLDSPQTIEGSVIIEDGVWIGANTYIDPGVVIGANSVVSANSVIIKSIPPGQIWGGVPARFLCSKKENS